MRAVFDRWYDYFSRDLRRCRDLAQSFLFALIGFFSLVMCLYCLSGVPSFWMLLFSIVCFCSAVIGFICSLRFLDANVIRIAQRFRELKKDNVALPDINTEHSSSDAVLTLLDITDASIKREYISSFLQRQANYNMKSSQISPHFLYNTLDSIRGQAALENAKVTERMIELLARMFRYTVSIDQDITTLEQELLNVDDYIEIMKYKSATRFSYYKILEDDEQLLYYKLPKLTLQPFVENAMKYGIKSMKAGGCITVKVYTTQSRLIISIADNGCGMDSEQLQQLNQKLSCDDYNASVISGDADYRQKTNSGIAIANVNARIKMTFGKKYGVLAFSIPEHGSEFQISLPLTEDMPNAV